MKKSGGRFAFFAARQKKADTAVFQTAPALVLRPVPDRKEWKDPMKDPLIIRENRDFVRLYKRGKSQVDPLLVTYALKSRRSCTRVGVTASKKVGGAVQRNRAKRVIRAAWRELAPTVPEGYDLIFVARGRTTTCKMQQVRRVMAIHLQRLTGVREAER